MFIWLWGASILVLCASLVFVYRILANSKELFAVQGQSPATPSKKEKEKEKGIIKELHTRISHLERANAYSELMLRELQEMLENLSIQKAVSKKAEAASTGIENGEDWEELYYEENETRHRLENELDLALQRIKDMEKTGANAPGAHSGAHLAANLEKAQTETVEKEKRIIQLLGKLKARETLIDEITEREEQLTKTLRQVQAQNRQLLSMAAHDMEVPKDAARAVRYHTVCDPKSGMHSTGTGCQSRSYNFLS